MTEEIRRYLDRADHALIVAEDLMERGHLESMYSPGSLTARRSVKKSGIRRVLTMV